MIRTSDSDVGFEGRIRRVGFRGRIREGRIRERRIRRSDSGRSDSEVRFGGLIREGRIRTSSSVVEFGGRIQEVEFGGQIRDVGCGCRIRKTESENGFGKVEFGGRIRRSLIIHPDVALFVLSSRGCNLWNIGHAFGVPSQDGCPSFGCH